MGPVQESKTGHPGQEQMLTRGISCLSLFEGIHTLDNPQKHIVIKKKADLEPFEETPVSGSNAMELSQGGGFHLY